MGNIKHVSKIGRTMLGLLLTMITLQILFSFRKNDTPPKEKIRLQLVSQLDQFSHYVKDTFGVLLAHNPSENELQQTFLKARQYYKKVEWAAEYFTYSTAKTINGAAKKELDITSQTITNPTGLQIIETFLYPHFDSSRTNNIQEELASLMDNIDVLQAYYTNIQIDDWQILDALKLEVFRIETIGLTGFDNALSLHSAEESAVSLASIQDAISNYNSSEINLLKTSLQSAISYLQSHTDFNQLDRALFITKYGNSITHALELVRRKYSQNALHYNRLLRQDAFTLFDSGAFDPSAYAPVFNQEKVGEKIQLGKLLFSDVNFSGNKTRSCASCHAPENAFANNAVKMPAIDGYGLIDRNTPTLLNTALQPQQFYDLRAPDIETQILDVIHNPKEMNGAIDSVVKTLRKEAKFQSAIQKAYPQKKELEKEDIVESLALYIRSLVKLNSRFDSYMQGNTKAMNANEINGFNLFMGKAQCATCHYMPLFNGVFPPKFITQDVEIIGVPATPISKQIDSDRGVWNVLLQQGVYDSLLLNEFDHGFKTVSVRNANRTAPYMHNGVFATLEEVMDFYNVGGGIGKGISVPNQSLSANKLNLTKKEIADIISFIKALDSR